MERFREFVKSAAQSDANQETLRRQIDLALTAWTIAFPGRPPLVPWPQFLSWSRPVSRRWLSGQEWTYSGIHSYHRGEFQKARREWERSLSVFQDIRDERTAAVVQMDLGLCAYEQGLLETAKTLFHHSLKTFQAQLFDPGIRDCLINLSLVAELQGQYAQAIRLLEEAWSINQIICEPEVEARILSSMGVVALECGYLEESEGLYRGSLALRLQLGDQEGQATDYSNLGIIFDERGFFREAYEYYEKSLQLRRLLQNREGEADSLLNLAVTLNHTGKAEEALQSILSALEICRSLGSPHRLMYTYIQAGEIYLEQGQTQESETHLQAAMTLARKHGFYKEQAWIRKVMAQAAQRKEQHDVAIGLLTEALQYYRENGNPLEIATSQVELGKAYRLQGNLQGALLQLLGGLRLAEKSGSLKILTEIQLLLGEIALQNGKPAIATQYFQQASSQATQTGYLRLHWQAAAGLSQAFQDQGLLIPAAHYLTQAIQLVADQEANLSRESLAVHFWDDKAYLFHKMSQLMSAQGADTDAWQWIDRMKARRLQRRWINESPEPTTDPADSTLGTTRAIQLIHQRLQAIPEGDTLAKADLSLELETLVPRHSPAISTPPTTPRTFSEVTENRLEMIQAHLEPDEALLDFAFEQESLRVWIVGLHSLQFKEWDCSIEEIKRLLSKAGLLAGEVSQKTIDANTTMMLPDLDLDTLSEIGRWVWEPIATLVPTSVKKLIVVPDGPLHLLPFDLLPSGTEQSSYSNPRGETLISRFAVSYLPAASLILSRESNPLPSAGSVKVTILAGQQKVPSQESRIGGEVQEIAELFPQANFFSSFHDWKSRAQGHLLQSDILHIASHYRPDPARPTASRFFFSPQMEKKDSFYAAEAVFLPLQSRLAVLSACHTAQGPIVSGEGILNMGRSFLLAGVRSIVLSSWPVEEKSTAELMSRFYRLLVKGMDSRDALRQAKMELRQFPAWQHPFYWGAFLLVGNPCRLVSAQPQSWFSWWFSLVIAIPATVVFALYLRIHSRKR